MQMRQGFLSLFRQNFFSPFGEEREGLLNKLLQMSGYPSEECSSSWLADRKVMRRGGGTHHRHHPSQTKYREKEEKEEKMHKLERERARWSSYTDSIARL